MNYLAARYEQVAASTGGSHEPARAEAVTPGPAHGWQADHPPLPQGGGGLEERGWRGLDEASSREGGRHHSLDPQRFRRHRQLTPLREGPQERPNELQRVHQLLLGVPAVGDSAEVAARGYGDTGMG